MARTLDPVLLEVMRNRFAAIAEEMGVSLVRTSYSTNIKDRRDCSCALFDVDGNVIAQAEHIPVHLGVLPFGVRGAIAAMADMDLQPGDAIMHNDPYVGGTHLPDLIVVAPIFHAGRIVGYAGNLAHHSDMGGMVPGSMPPRASEIYQEGIRFPPVRIRKAGVINAEILRIHANNVRTPYESQGDLFAQLASNNVGMKRFAELYDEFGAETVEAAIAELAEYTNRRMAVELARIPEGVYSFSDVLEGDGFTADPITIAVTVTCRDGKLSFDFAGSSPQTTGPVNAVAPITISAVYYVVKAITDPSIPPNHGTFRDVEILAPEGTIVNARHPAPTNAANGATAQRIVDVLLGALYQAMPDRVCAASTGSMNSVQIGGYRSSTKEYYVHPETYGGGYGATARADGASGVQTHMTNTRNAPVEVLESTLPVRVLQYGLVPDSEGPGRYRGGFGICRHFEILDDGVECMLSADRFERTPWGLDEGQPAAATVVQLIRDGVSQRVGPKTYLHLKKGDQLVMRTAGGGGRGDPSRRDRQALAHDVAEGLISKERAEAFYG